MRVETSEMTARSRRDPAAKGRIFETLRKMPQRDAIRLKLVLQRWAIGPAFNQCGPRYLIHLNNLTEIAQVKCDGRLVAKPMDSRLDTAADARPAPERRQRGADTTGPVHHSGNLCFVAGISDDVGRAIGAAGHGTHVAWIGFAIGVRDAGGSVGRAESGNRGRRRHARRAPWEILSARHGYGFEPIAP